MGKSIEVKVGNVTIGGNNPIVIQSMTNTDTMDTMATVNQALRMVESGCQMVRITSADEKSAQNLYNIKNELLKRSCEVPIVADIHFNPKAALIAASIVEKIRINPGNYVDRRWNDDMSNKDYEDILKRAADNIYPLVEVCKKHSTAVRIGVNDGSLSQRILYKYGNTPKAMAESAMEFIRMFDSMDFKNLVISIKASTVSTMYDANKLLVEMMQKENLYFPLHLGVTEAGGGLSARVKSAAGIGALLMQGIGDTIRVSLTEKPENEMPFAYLIVSTCSKRQDKALQYDNETTLNKNDVKYIAENALQTLNRQRPSLKETNIWDKEILQALGIKRYKADIFACPSCGRTQYDIQSALSKVEKACGHLLGLRIGVMGCIVNGIGEASGADYAYIGSGNGTVNIYRGSSLVKSHIPESLAIDELVSIIKLDGLWADKS